MPETFDIERNEDRMLFELEYERQLVFSYVKYFIQKMKEAMPKYYNKIASSKFLYRDAAMMISEKGR
jgi:hypothetical protein